MDETALFAGGTIIFTLVIVVFSIAATVICCATALRPLDRLMTLTERWKIAMMAIHLRHQAHVGTTYKRALP